MRLSTLQRDLLHWSTLYCAGRLHKPVATLAAHPGVAAAQEANLAAALRVALLLLPEKFGTLVSWWAGSLGLCTAPGLEPSSHGHLRAGGWQFRAALKPPCCPPPQDLLHSICALSYSGDVRMGLAEDSRKVHRIVAGSEAGLRQLYAAPLAAAQQRWGVLQPTGEPGGDAWVCDHSQRAAEQLAQGLPAHLLERLAAPLGLPLALHPPDLSVEPQPAAQLPPELAAVGRALAAQAPQRRRRLLRHAIHAIVGASSKRQAASGLLTAGLLKSARYGLAKLRKAWK